MPPAGITLPAWLRLLRRYGSCIDWAMFWQRALFLTLMSVMNSLLGLVDSLLYGRKIREQASPGRACLSGLGSNRCI